MAVKHIKGTYADGYALAPTFSGAEVSPTGAIGGTGLSAQAPASVFNAGLIEATAYGASGVDPVCMGRDRRRSRQGGARRRFNGCLKIRRRMIFRAIGGTSLS